MKYSFLNLTRQNVIAAVLFLFPLVATLIVTLVPFIHKMVSPALEHLLLTLTAVTGIHFVDRIFLFKETYSALETITDRVKEDVREQTRTLVDNSESYQAMIASDIGRIYSSREDASSDMYRDLVNPENRRIRIIGISLNDFIRVDNGVLASAWEEIQNAIEADRHMDIKLLIINPDCFGAQLRSEGEARTQPSIAGRLREDVIAVGKSLLKIEDSVRQKKNVKFECRFYHTAPILFLCQVDSASYVQQYYFWSQRKPIRSCPVIRYRHSGEINEGALLYSGMSQHFEWIWNHASMPVASYLLEHSKCKDKGIYQSGVVNVFSNTEEARERIRWLLENATQEVSIQGISLHSFFEPGDLFNAIVGLMERGVEVKLLVLDSCCEQAQYRSYREYLLAGRELTFDDYKESGTHNHSDLYRDTERTIENLRQKVAATVKSNDGGSSLKISIKKYKTAPSCFMLRADDTVLVEQYHYGKVVPDGQDNAPSILGKDMPLIEYAKCSSSLYDPIGLRSPFALLESHFAYSFENAEKINL